MRDYQEHAVVAELQKKSDLQIENRTITELTRNFSKGDVGIKSKAKIQFLKKYKGYLHVFVDKFEKKW